MSMKFYGEQTMGLIDVFPTLMDYCGLPHPPQSIEGLSLRPLLKNPTGDWTRPAFTVYEENYFSARDERWRYLIYPDGSEELYDHQSDPFEFKNLAAENEFEAVKHRLKRWAPAHWAPSLGGCKG